MEGKDSGYCYKNDFTNGKSFSRKLECLLQEHVSFLSVSI